MSSMTVTEYLCFRWNTTSRTSSTVFNFSDWKNKTKPTKTSQPCGACRLSSALLELLSHWQDYWLVSRTIVHFLYSVKCVCVCVANISNIQYFFVSTLIQVPPASNMLQFVCVVWELMGVRSQPHRGSPWSGAAESSVRGDHSYEQWPLCPVPPPPFNLRQAHCKESPWTLWTPFSPWEISDINRSTCLPYNL